MGKTMDNGRQPNERNKGEYNGSAGISGVRPESRPLFGHLILAARKLRCLSVVIRSSLLPWKSPATIIIFALPLISAVGGKWRCFSGTTSVFDSTRISCILNELEMQKCKINELAFYTNYFYYYK